MPIYEYRCLSCQKNFEKLIRNNKEAISCPYCHAKDIKRILSLFGFKEGRKGNSSQERGVSSNSSCASCTSKNCSQCH